MHTAVINKRRPLIYAIVMTIGFIFLQNILHTAPDQYFFTGILFLYPILLFELLTTRYYGQLLLNQFSLPPVEENRDKFIHLIHHLILPSLLYFSFVTFFYYHQQLTLQPVLILLVFFIFWILFTNIRAFYEDKFKLEILTHNVYDIIIIFAAFFCYASTINIFLSNNWPVLAMPIPQALLYILLYKLVIIRYQIKITAIFWVLLLLIFTALAVIIAYLGIKELAGAFLLTEIFYFTFAYTLHNHDGTANLKIFAEYIIIFLISIVLLISI